MLPSRSSVASSSVASSSVASSSVASSSYARAPMRTPVAMLVLWACGSVCASACGGAPAARNVNRPSTRARSAPLSVAANQNAPSMEPGADEADLAPVALWCSDPEGPACRAAGRALGVGPVATERIPLALLVGARDAEDDCQDPDVVATRDRVAGALELAGPWRDEPGQIEEPSRLSDPRAGGGCVNELGLEPRLKIHVVDLSGDPHVLARVWELDR